MFREQKAKREICFASHFGASITRDAVPAGKAVVTRRIPSIFRALCRRPLRAAKHEKRFQNVSRSPERARCCDNTPRADICSLPRAPNANGTWPNLRWSIRPMLRGSNRTCRSVDFKRQITSAPRLRKRQLRPCRSSRSFPSVRGYGLRTYEPRQSRNAATVV